MRSRARYIQLGVPAAVMGVLATAFSAVPAQAATPAESASGNRLAPLPRIVPAATAPASYTVRDGDTVFTIAQRFGLRTVDVLTWNDLSWRSVIFPGQTLTLKEAAVPASAPAAPRSSAPAPAARSHTVVAGDTVFAIARKYDTSVAAIYKANGLGATSVIYPGQKISVSGEAAPATAAKPATAPAQTTAPAHGATHKVVTGDTIFAIAQKHDTSVAAIYKANGLSSASIIYPGQSLVVAAAAPAAASDSAKAAPLPAQTASLNAPQAENAAMIIRIGRELGVSDRGIAIALATSMVESWLRNLDWGDRDSLGLFQQRPSTGWGTKAEIMDRDRSIRVFYGGSSDPNGATTKGLLDIAGWEGMDFKDAAQSVQISAYPERYAQWEAEAYRWIALYG